MKTLKGKVISTKMNKSIVVKVSRMIAHPKYKKLMKRDSNFIVHNEKEVNVGDMVSIVPCKRISKNKYFKVV
jgi:small subunit ribosomal protein S17